MIAETRTCPVSPEPTVECILITPDLALEWLEQKNTNNRRISDKHVQRLARDITDGKWRLTPQGILFDPDGTLLDGQHRLWAIALSGIPIEMFVWQNVDPTTMMAIDSGKARSLADILNIAGENGVVSNQHLATLRQMLGGFGNPPVLSPAQASEVLRQHREAIEFSLVHLPSVSTSRGVNTATTRAVIARAYYCTEPLLLKDFCRKLTTGVVTSNSESIIVLLRQHLQQNHGNSFCQRMQRYGKVERVLVAWLKGENPSRLYPVSAEYFPLPEEVSD